MRLRLLETNNGSILAGSGPGSSAAPAHLTSSPGQAVTARTRALLALRDIQVIAAAGRPVQGVLVWARAAGDSGLARRAAAGAAVSDALLDPVARRRVADRLDLAVLQVGNDLLQALPPPSPCLAGPRPRRDPVVFDGSGHGLTVSTRSPPRAVHDLPCARAVVDGYTFRAGPCSTLVPMEKPGHRLNVTLDPEHAARLARLAERPMSRKARLRGHCSPSRSRKPILKHAMRRGARRDPGRSEHALQSLERARAGETVALDEL